jgi:DNA-binding Lrp family transcriptional regulator
MAKTSGEHLYNDEKKLLAELVNNARKNISTLAKNTKFSTQKVRFMINQLEKNNTIWGYSTVYDEKKMGLKHFMLMVKRSNKKIDEQTIDQIISRKVEDFALDFDTFIESSFYVHGEYDWIITFVTKDINHALKFSESVLAQNPGIIERVTILQTMMFIRKHYILNPDRKELKEYL